MTETLSALTDPAKGMLEPVQKLNQEAVSMVEKLAEHQIKSLKTYSALGVSQLKAAAEVKNVEGLQDLMSRQTDFMRKFGECLMSDFKAIFAMGTEFLSKATKVGAEPVLEAPVKAKATPKAA
jgi:phasin family protein